MNCPKCESTVTTFLSEVSWQIPWEPQKDLEGGLHKHDPNKHFRDYKCTNGHVFEESFFPTCHCGWQADNA